MTQYIPKAAVVAELERRIKERDFQMNSGCWVSSTFMYEDLLDFLDTIEVKEVDLSLIEPHIKEEWNKINTGHTYSIIDSYNIFVGICTYFYELGLKAQKGK